MARVTWLCGLRLETFDHGIFVGKPYQKIAWYRRARHPSSIIKGVIQGNFAQTKRCLYYVSQVAQTEP